jgi:hypothetical protein
MANFTRSGVGIGSQLSELHGYWLALGFDPLAAEQGCVRFITGENPSGTGKAEGHQQMANAPPVNSGTERTKLADPYQNQYERKKSEGGTSLV